MKPQQQLAIRAGDVPRVKQMSCTIAPGKLATLRAPPGRELVTLVLGVSDPGVPFDVDAMLGALGYVKKE